MIDPQTASANALWTIPELRAMPLVTVTGAAGMNGEKRLAQEP